MITENLLKACLAVQDHLHHFYRELLDEGLVQPETCKTCVYWGKEEPDPHYKRCAHPKLAPRNDYRDGATDSEGYGGIITGLDFGCRHYKEKT